MNMIEETGRKCFPAFQGTLKCGCSELLKHFLLQTQLDAISYKLIHVKGAHNLMDRLPTTFV